MNKLPIPLIYLAISASAASVAGAADNTYYLWAGATKVNEEVNLLNASNWSTSDAGYVAPAEGTLMNSPQANWVFDHDAYLPVSGRTDAIFYRIKDPVLDIASITIVNHNATDIKYWANESGQEVLKESGAKSVIKFVSGASNSSWNIGTFTYTGRDGSWDTGVIFGAGQITSFQTDLTFGTLNLGYGENATNFRIGDYAAGTTYATVEDGDVKVGDPVMLADTTGVKSLTVNGDVNLHGNTTFNMNVWNEDPMASHSEYSPDALIQGVVRMAKSENGKTATWNVLHRTSTITWKGSKPAVPATDTYIKLGGLQGEGTVSNDSKTLDPSAVKLIFTNTSDCEFSGNFTENRFDSSGKKEELTTVMSVKMAGQNGAKQIIRADADFTGTVEVESGTLIMHSTNSLGKLTMTGGAFGGIDGGIVVSSAEWKAGDFIFYSSDALNGGVPDMIRIEGTFTKAGDGKIGIDFAGFDPSVFIEDGTVLELITANALEGAFSADANDDFAAKNLINGIADFAWAGNTLTVSFAKVPEPAAFAALFGAVALAFAARRARKI